MIALGSFVYCSKVAYVARRYPKNTWGEDGNWFTPTRGNFETLTLHRHGEGQVMVNVSVKGFGNLQVEHLLPVVERHNKTVIAVPCTRSGYVIGLERKMCGVSHAGNGEDDYGFFEEHGHVDLYVVKSDLRGKPFYVPESAISFKEES